MQKLMSYKKTVICACAAVVGIAVAAVVLLSNKEEAFRSILVYDVEGDAVIERETVGVMNAAENLYLESGDRVSVAAESSMRMKLDDDKYVMAEADTIFSVEAEGTETDSKTKICLEQGAITNEIQHPLSEGAVYETSTPNSVMAVRGTIYRVELYAGEDGSQNTKLCCFQGKVGTKPILPNGAYGEEILVPAGSELVVYPDGTAGEVSDIAYDELPPQAVINLLDMMERGQDVSGISAEDLAQLTPEAGDSGEQTHSEPAQAETEAANSESDAVEETDAQIHTETDRAGNVPAKPFMEKPQTPAMKPSAGQPAPRQAQPQAPVMKPTAPSQPVNSGNVDQGNMGGDGSRNENIGNDSDKDKSDGDKKDKPSKPKTYTVTFQYQGEVFATQAVKRGETAVAPVLVPALSGAWDFDFETKIEADTTIMWK